MSDMTTTQNGFKVIDVTFRGARKQSEINKEKSDNEAGGFESSSIPVSLTPEQVISFYNRKIEETHIEGEKRVYERTISWIRENEALKKKLVNLELKQVISPVEETSIAEEKTED